MGKRIPSRDDVLRLLDLLNEHVADDLESDVLEFKLWEEVKKNMIVAAEYAVCFANAHGGLIVFGVKDRTRGRKKQSRGVSVTIWMCGDEESIKARTRRSPLTLRNYRFQKELCFLLGCPRPRQGKPVVQQGGCSRFA